MTRAILRFGLALWLAAVLLAPVGARPHLAGAASPCDVSAAHMLAPGGDSDWSSVNDLIAYDRPDDAGVYQLRTIRPDGAEDRCLSCTTVPGAPRVDRHKMAPVWHPSGRFVVLQGEMDSHPFAGLHNLLLAELQINGVWMNLYATTEDGARWWRLTEYASDHNDGAMAAHFSVDGRQLLWSRLVDSEGRRAPWGTWRLMLGDFVEDASGTPSLENVRDVTPTDGGTFFESHGFSPDGGAVVFTSDRGTTHAWGMDLWTMDLASGELRNLTKSDQWEEHASYSPDGGTIAYMSSEPYSLATWLFRGESGTELYVMAADGSHRRQVTHFNVPGYPESDPTHHSMPHRANWSADGSRLALTRQLAGKDYPNRELWLLTFAGRCGAAPT